MDTKNNSLNRPLSNQTFGMRLYEDNCEIVTHFCDEAGRKPGEVLRDLVDEAIQARRNPPIPTDEIMQTLQQLLEQNRQLIEQNRLATERHEQLVQRYEEVDERSKNLEEGLIQNLREFYAILLETLSAAIGARRLTWNYLAHTVLKQSGYNDEQITQRYNAEKKAWIGEKDGIANYLEEEISKMPPQQ
jgi:hypothetical protein